MTEHYTVTGTLSDQTTVILDEPILLPTNRVRITLEVVPNFWKGATVAELAEMQGVMPVESLDDMWADFWPEDESIDDFIETIYQWRRESLEL